MIVALSEGSWLSIGLVAVGVLLFAIKALVHKIISPVKTRQAEQESFMQLMDQRVKVLEDDKKLFITKLDSLPNQLKDQAQTITDSIKETLTANERYYDSRYVHQKKQ